MRDSFIDTAELVLRFKEHKDSLIRRTVITMIPTLAVYDTQIFSEHFLHKAMGHLLPQLKKPSERSIGKEPLLSHIVYSSYLECLQRSPPSAT